LRRSIIQFVIAAPVIVALSTVSGAQLDNVYRTVDGDRITISGEDGYGDGEVNLCLYVPAGALPRQVRVNGGGSLHGVSGALRCLSVPARETRLEFIKLGKSGIALSVGETQLDFSGYGGGTINLTWGGN
jgi:hypothetical protein